MRSTSRRHPTGKFTGRFSSSTGATFFLSTSIAAQLQIPETLQMQLKTPSRITIVCLETHRISPGRPNIPIIPHNNLLMDDPKEATIEDWTTSIGEMIIHRGRFSYSSPAHSNLFRFSKLLLRMHE